MIKNILSLGIALMLSSCGGTSTKHDNAQGPTSSSTNTLGVLSNEVDVSQLLEKDAWTSIEMDLETFLYDRKSTQKTYDIELRFESGRVYALADCYMVEAHYKIKDDEVVFSRLSSPRPAIEVPTCKEFEDAENAVSSFLSYNYTYKKSTKEEIVLEGTDIETSVTLGH